MKVKYFILILGLIFFIMSCQKDKSQLERSWILVENKSEKGFIPVQRGCLIHFDRDSLFISYPTSLNDTAVNYIIQEDYIKVDTMVFGKILHVSKDSLIIEDHSKEFDMHFRSLDETTFSEVNQQKFQQTLTNTIWSITDADYAAYKMYCSDENWGIPYENNNDYSNKFIKLTHVRT